MSLSALRLALLTAACVAGCAPAHTAAASDTYLSWSGKTPATATVQTTTGSYAVPPSPYGQVGDPFTHTLDWSGKHPSAPQSAAQPAPQPQPPVQVATVTPPSQPWSQPFVAPASPPVQRAAPPVRRATGRYVDTPAPPQQIEPEDDDTVDGVNAVTAPAPAVQPMPDPAPVAAPSPVAAIQAPPAAALAPADTGDYQVPASSPYAARIAEARAAQAAVEQAAQQQAANTPPPAPAKPSPAKAVPAKPAAPATPPAAALATAPEPAEPLAAQETDHVFIPGEQYTSTADAPRFYSLVREYGMKPDPITVDTNAGGALLSPLSDVKTPDDHQDDSRDDNDTSDNDSTDDDTP